MPRDLCCAERIDAEDNGVLIVWETGPMRFAINTIGEDYSLPISHCPWCGTKLDKGAEGVEDDEEEKAPRLADPASLPPALFDLVPLSSLPESTWKGRAVFHPCGQDNKGAQWVADDLSGPPAGTACYDVGVVERHEPDPDFADLGVIRVWFVGSMGSRLHYASSNLWTPLPAGEPPLTPEEQKGNDHARAEDLANRNERAFESLVAGDIIGAKAALLGQTTIDDPTTRVDPPPRYDDVFHKGTAWLQGIDYDDAEPPRGSPPPDAKCYVCLQPATCWGRYDSPVEQGGCDTHCGHGNEDGYCTYLDPERL